jgi:hypothetical protein
MMLPDCTTARPHILFDNIENAGTSRGFSLVLESALVNPIEGRPATEG